MRPGPTPVSAKRGSALLEFAIAWPICLVLVAGAIQLSIWGAESHAARQAALAGARAGSARGAAAGTADSVALAALSRSLIGAHAASWCPGSAPLPPVVWVCSSEVGGLVEVRVGGTVPSLLPLLPGGGGLAIAADVVLAREEFRP